LLYGLVGEQIMSESRRRALTTCRQGLHGAHGDLKAEHRATN
jgi:hypothetical protein